MTVTCTMRVQRVYPAATSKTTPVAKVTFTKVVFVQNVNVVWFT